MEPIIHGRGLVKRFGSLTAVDGIDFAIMPQECFGFLGPNGAGKTTTIRMIICAAPPSAGSLYVDGKDVTKHPRDIKAVLGVVPQEDNLDPDLTVIQNLLVYARYFDIPKSIAKERARSLLEMLQLTEKRGVRIEELSGGLKRRLILARALINEPKVLVLDEPTTGLDPQARHMIWQKLRQLKAQGITLVLTSHYMEEAAHLCDRLVIMHEGRILTQGTPQELIGRHVGKEVVEVRVDDSSKDAVLSKLAGHKLNVEAVEDTIYVFGDDSDPLQGVPMNDSAEVIRRRATLEDVFLRLTGRALLE